MPFRVELSARAERDVRGIYHYIREHGPADPDDWKNGLESKLCSLERFPEGCGLAPENEFTKSTIRQVLCGPFRILFELRDQTVYVLTIRHGAREFLNPDELESS